jgi:hypothetical protein
MAGMRPHGVRRFKLRRGRLRTAHIAEPEPAPSLYRTPLEGGFGWRRIRRRRQVENG